MTSLAIVVVALATGAAPTGPAELLHPEVPAGFELADGADADLTFDEYAPLAPEATAHVDAASAEARAMRAAVDVWTAREGDILLREVTLWTTDDAARAFVDQAVVVGTEDELDEADAPFEGGLAFLGADEGLWTRTLTWRQGTYGITISHFSIEEGTDRTIGEAAESLAANVEAMTGHGIATSGVRPDATGATDPAAHSGGTSGGIPIGAVLIWSAVVAGAIWLFMTRRMIARRTGYSSKRKPSDAAGDDPDDPDDIGELIDVIPDRS